MIFWTGAAESPQAWLSFRALLHIQFHKQYIQRVRLTALPGFCHTLFC